MSKKTKCAINIVLLVLFCLGIFAACGQTRPDFFGYSEDDLGVMGKLVKLMHENMMGKGNYGWTVVVFTVFLKILMLPLDIWQRYAARKSSLKMQIIQPIMENIDKKYGANTQRANSEKQKVYKKQGVSMLSSCLPMIVSMVIFFIMFAGLRNYSTYSSITNFRELTRTYYTTYSEQLKASEYGSAYLDGYEYIDRYGMQQEKLGYNDAFEQDVSAAYNSKENKNEDGTFKKTEEQIRAELANDLASQIRCQNYGILAARAKENDDTKKYETCDAAETASLAAVKEYYNSNHESWLWIKNVWQPDTWAEIMQPFSGGQFEGGGFSAAVEMKNFPDGGEDIYNKLRNAVMDGNGYDGKGGWNGLMILPFASIGLSFLSMFISQRMERKNRKGEVVEQNQQQKVTNRTMMIIMPLMMAWFGFIYTGAFAIYMVVNYTLSIISTVALRVPVEKLVLRRINKEEAKNNTVKAKYKR